MRKIIIKTKNKVGMENSLQNKIGIYGVSCAGFFNFVLCLDANGAQNGAFFGPLW